MPRARDSKGDESLRALLVSNGLKVTEQRLSILRALSWSRLPVSFPELERRLAAENLNRATIYRNLMMLTEAGILSRTQLGDGLSRYELPVDSTGGHNLHPHLVCVDCESVTCLPARSVILKGEAASRVTEVLLRGRCASCAEPAKPRPRQPRRSP